MATAIDNQFTLRVVGNSMEPEFWEGDVIIVDPARQPASGSYVIAKVDGGSDGNGDATFKQFVADAGRVFLKPLNSRYPVMDMTGREFRVVGVVVEKRKEYV
ncbi:MAG: S24 family peptidase [Thermodesulfobacteriota bacterium]